MTRDDYKVWSDEHAALFALRDPLDAKWFAALAPILMPFDLAELRAASVALATGSSTSKGFRADHCEALRSHILARRAEAAAAERDRQERELSNSSCPDCNGVGLVRVPHPGHVADGVLVRPYFIAVSCLCAAGVARHNAINAKLGELKSDQRLIDLAELEMHLPDWRTIAAAYAEATAREGDAADVAIRADRTTPIDTAAIAERLVRR